MRFWDSSALVPLVITQRQSQQVERWVTDDPQIAMWTCTPVEVTSALWRLVRDGVLKEADAHSAEEVVEHLAAASYLVTDVEGVKRHARRLLRLHALRAADALQLGAAVRWSAASSGAATLHTLDERLMAAARREGFDVPSA